MICPICSSNNTIPIKRTSWVSENLEECQDCGATFDYSQDDFTIPNNYRSVSC